MDKKLLFLDRYTVRDRQKEKEPRPAKLAAPFSFEGPESEEASGDVQSLFPGKGGVVK